MDCNVCDGRKPMLPGNLLKQRQAATWCLILPELLQQLQFTFSEEVVWQYNLITIRHIALEKFAPREI